MKKNNHYYVTSLCYFILLALLNGCTLTYKSTGKVLTGYASDQAVPYTLATGDVGLTCSMVESFTPFLLSFSQVEVSSDQLAILFYLMAGNCTEFKAQEQELRYLRAIFSKNEIEAQDARIAQQRLLSLAASRQLLGYQYLAKAFVEPGNECPEFNSEPEELYWLLGLLNGIQAIMNDVASGGMVEVPLNTAAKVGRASACLDNQKWWGTPKAIQAAIWMISPTGYPVDKDPEQILKQSIKMSLQKGVKITQVLAAQVYLGRGDIEKVKGIIRHYEKGIETPATETFKMLNQVSRLQIQAISDRLWTEATGSRTPLGKLGSFWDDPVKTVDMIDIDEFL